MANEKRLTWKRSLDGCEDVGLCEGVTIDEAICKLADLEERGAVLVVRCKDCKHRAIGDDVCIHPNRIGDGYIEVKDDDFCSYGERREGE